MGGGGIHVQLPYTVINMWRINVWRGIDVQLTYTVINMWRINVWVEGTFTCSYHTQ